MRCCIVFRDDTIQLVWAIENEDGLVLPDGPLLTVQSFLSTADANEYLRWQGKRTDLPARVARALAVYLERDEMIIPYCFDRKPATTQRVPSLPVASGEVSAP